MMLLSYLGVSCFALTFSVHSRELAAVYGKLSSKYARTNKKHSSYVIKYLGLHSILASNIFAD